MYPDFDIKKCIDLVIHEGLIRNLFTYGISGSFYIWLEKSASTNIVDLINNLNDEILLAIKRLDDKGLEFSKKYIDNIEFMMILDNSIDVCKLKHGREKTRTEIGDCIINKYIDFVIKIISSLVKETILYMIENKFANLEKIKNFNDLVKFEGSNLKGVNTALLTLYSSQDFNKYFTFISNIEKGNISNEMKLNSINHLDSVVLKYISINDSIKNVINY